MLNLHMLQQYGNPNNNKDAESDFAEAAARLLNHQKIDVSKNAGGDE